MSTKHTFTRARAATALAVAALGTSLALDADAQITGGFQTAIGPYIVPAVPGYTITPLLSVGDHVPLTGDPATEYQMVGIPDGMGAYRNADGSITLMLNHEFGNAVRSVPVIDGPTNRGAIVSKFVLGVDATILSGRRAYDWVYQENTLVGPAAEVGNTTPGFGRFCSASLSGPEAGFDRPIYFTNEESDPPGTFDPRGGQSVAIFDNEAHTLPKLGFFPWENTLAMSFPGNKTVIMGNEDGPTSPDSQLYMYVGKKDPNAVSVLRRNGLDNGTLYVLASAEAGKSNETTFTSGSLATRWVEIPNAESLSAPQLEAAADALGAFGFVRVEDGAFGKTSRKDYWFVTTGGNKAASNELGRLYHLAVNPGNPTQPGTLTVIYNADTVVAAGGDIALSPDNIDVNGDHLMVQEDGTTQSRAVFAAKGRDAGIWRFDLDNPAAPVFVAELNPPGRDGTAVGPGIWESSGIIDSTDFYGSDTWLLDVQAHSPTAAPAPGTVEDGQLAIMFPTP